MKRLLIYGATGYTGRMASDNAKAAGLNFVIAGRDPAGLASLAATLGVEYLVFTLDNTATVDAALASNFVVLNCAGPFKQTAEPLMKAAIRTGTHYLDVAAELDGYLLAEKLDAEAKSAGVMLLPGGGGSVGMLGSLASIAAGSTSRPMKIGIALQVSGSMSRGSAISASGGLTTDLLVRKEGSLAKGSSADLRDFDFGTGPVACFPVTLPDLVTVWHATKIPNIETFVHVSGNSFPAGDLADMLVGPDARERESNRYQAAVEVTGEDGTVHRATLDTVNGYTFTAVASIEAARRILAGEIAAGFQTPVEIFGPRFAETIADTQIVNS
jgi:short subunit dehydrogenase-like uncharacterized protein